jgi:hypothetical protein
MPEPADPGDKEGALTQLEDVLNFYFSKGEVEAWRS